MPLPRTSSAEISHHLDLLKIADGDRLAVHSRLLSFGIIEGGTATLANALRERIGPSGTLIVPTYTFDSALPYNPATRPGEATGALSEYVRKLPGAIRSLCPIHNHAGIGPDAGLLRQSDPECSLGPGSDFDLMHRHGFKLLLLGCDFNEGCTYLHHMEAVANLSYRQWLTLERIRIEPDATEVHVHCRYFGRARTDLVTDFEPVQRHLSQTGALTTIPCAMGHSHTCRIETLHTVSLSMLEANPMALVGG